MEAQFPEQEESVYALEGTCAHALAEIKVRHFICGEISEATYNQKRKRWLKEWSVPERQEFEMDAHTDAFVDLVRERSKLYPGSQVMVEQRLDTGVPSCWGTSDVVIVSPHHVEIVDFKYGAGVAVEAEGNPQLRLYGCGALDTYGDMLGDTELVRITVHQPRLEHTLTEELTPLALREWRDSIIPIAELALTDDAPFGPSESACRWCPAAGNCRAQTAWIFEDEDLDFTSDPDAMDEDEIAAIIKKSGAIRDWLTAVEDKALHRAYSEGKVIPGYKVVMSGGKRSIPDEDAAIEYMTMVLGYDEEQVSRRKTKTLGDLEALMGAQNFAQKMKEFIKKPEGRPSLVPDSDSRPSIQPNSEAAKDFAGEDLL